MFITKASLPGLVLGALAMSNVLGASAADLMPVNGAQLEYVSEGEGVPVLFVHGAVSDHRAWAPYRRLLSGKWRVIAYDQRYFGTAEWPDDGREFPRETHVRDLIAFVEGLDVGPVHLVTWSYGGGVGAYATLKRPELFRSIVHYEPGISSLLTGLPGSDNATKELFSQFGPAVTAAKENRPEEAALRLIEAVFELPAGGALSESEMAVKMWRENGRTVKPWLAMAPAEPLSCEAFSKLDVPTLVVQGADTYTWFSMVAEQLVNCQPNATLATLPGVNHDGPYRAPDMFASVIDRFISSVPVTAGQLKADLNPEEN